MSVRPFVLSSLVLAALARAACAVAEESSDGAVLGPAEPIGKLLIVKAAFDDEPDPVAPIPMLEPAAISLPPGSTRDIVTCPMAFGSALTQLWDVLAATSEMKRWPSCCIPGFHCV